MEMRKMWRTGLMPYKDKEKQKAYCRNYQAKQRELLKKLVKSVQKDGESHGR
jgi:hypothetical protein